MPVDPGRPWYRQFWPWFLVALFAAAVAGSVYTVLLSRQYGPRAMPGAARFVLQVAGQSLRLSGSGVGDGRTLEMKPAEPEE